MFEIRGKRIRISRGDTGQVVIAAKGATFTEADRAIVSVKREAEDREALIEKVLTVSPDGTCVFRLENADTQDMEPGAYVWDVRFVLGATLDEAGRVTDGEDVLTPFAPQTFDVMEAVGDV